MTDLRIDEIVIPASIDDADAADFLAAIDVTLTARADPFGDHLIFRPREELFNLHDPSRRNRQFVARLDGRVVGRGGYSVMPNDTTTAWAGVEVLPEFRNRGVGSALLTTIEDAIRADGRKKIIADIRTDEDLEGPQIPSPTGYGSIPAETPQTTFLQKRDYTFEQVNRLSRVDLPVAMAQEVLDETLPFAGPDYALHYWIGPTPERWRDSVASLASRLATDVPYGDLAPPEDPWDADRVAAEDARRVRDAELTRVMTAVEHVPSGAIVGYTELLVAPDTDRDAIQWFTVVDPTHRGHRLGTLIKVGNLLYIAREYPDRPGVVTGNAEENRPMLDINERLGFVRIGQHTEWKKEL